MRYEDIYRQAMDKVQASENWKADTLAKMAAAAPQKPRLTVWRRALPVAAAAAVCLAAVLSLSLSDGISTAPAPSEQSAVQDSAPQALAAMPRMAMAEAGFVPGCLPADAQETDVPDPDIAALLEEGDLPETLPVWEQTDAEPALLGEYDTVSAADALALAGLAESDTQPRLVYLAGGGYIQPAWKLESQGETVYLSALGG